MAAVLVCASGDLDEEDDRHPLGGRADADARQELHVHRAGDHQQGDEQRPYEG